MRTTLLLVEDDIDLGELTKMSLELRGYDVTLARDPEQAVAAIQQARPDIAVIDYFLERNATGLDALKQLRQFPAMNGVPVFFMSGLLDTEIEKQIFAEGALGLLTKPLQFNTLVARLQEALAQPSSTTGDASEGQR